MHVRLDVLAVSAIAGKGSLSKFKRPMNSAAMCCESAALPPFPARRTLPLFLNVSTKSWDAFSRLFTNEESITDSELTLPDS